MIGEYSGFFNIFSEKKILKNGQVLENQYIIGYILLYRNRLFIHGIYIDEGEKL